MSARFARDTLLRNWYLIVALVLVAVILGVKLSTGGDNTPAREDTAQATRQARSAPATAQTPPAGWQPAEQRERERALAQIREYEVKLEEEQPEEAQAAVLWGAMGNLYRQKLGDYGEAARCYEMALYNEPEPLNARKIYVQLGTCYERLRDKDKQRKLYEEMLEVFPEGSQEYEYANAKLKAEI